MNGEKGRIMATQYHFFVANESIEVQTGVHASPNITITMKESDYLDMVNGKLNGQMAFVSGKLKITGDMGLAMRLQNLFSPPEANSPPPETVQEVIDGLPEAFNAEAAKGMNAVYQFDLTGEAMRSSGGLEERKKSGQSDRDEKTSETAALQEKPSVQATTNKTLWGIIVLLLVLLALLWFAE